MNQYPSPYLFQETIATAELDSVFKNDIQHVYIVHWKNCPLFVMLSEASVADAKLVSLALCYNQELTVCINIKTTV